MRRGALLGVAVLAVVTGCLLTGCGGTSRAPSAVYAQPPVPVTVAEPMVSLPAGGGPLGNLQDHITTGYWVPAGDGHTLTDAALIVRNTGNADAVLDSVKLARGSQGTILASYAAGADRGGKGSAAAGEVGGADELPTKFINPKSLRPVRGTRVPAKGTAGDLAGVEIVLRLRFPSGVGNYPDTGDVIHYHVGHTKYTTRTHNKVLACVRRDIKNSHCP